MCWCSIKVRSPECHGPNRASSPRPLRNLRRAGTVRTEQENDRGECGDCFETQNRCAADGARLSDAVGPLQAFSPAPPFACRYRFAAKPRDKEDRNEACMSALRSLQNSSSASRERPLQSLVCHPRVWSCAPNAVLPMRPWGFTNDYLMHATNHYSRTLQSQRIPSSSI